MDGSDKKEILEAIGALAVHVDERIGGVEERIGGLEDRVGNLAQEMRSGFTEVNGRLDTLEEAMSVLSAAFDTQLEDVLGRKDITLTRNEYDVLVDAHKLPNRFTERTHATG